MLVVVEVCTKRHSSGECRTGCFWLDFFLVKLFIDLYNGKGILARVAGIKVPQTKLLLLLFIKLLLYFSVANNLYIYYTIRTQGI